MTQSRRRQVKSMFQSLLIRDVNIDLLHSGTVIPRAQLVKGYSTGLIRL